MVLSKWFVFCNASDSGSNGSGGALWAATSENCRLVFTWPRLAASVLVLPVFIYAINCLSLSTAMPQTNETPKTVMLCTSCKEGPRVVAHHAASSPQDAPPPLGLPRPPAAGCALRSCTRQGVRRTIYMAPYILPTLLQIGTLNQFQRPSMAAASSSTSSSIAFLHRLSRSAFHSLA